MGRYKANLPFVGIASFGKAPICEDLETLEADAAILGVPYDGGISYRTGTRLGPRDIREHSTRYSAWGSWGKAGYWDIDTKRRTLERARIVDAGDVDIVYADEAQNFANIAEAVQAIRRRGALPVLLGGDHSVTYPIVRAFEGTGPIGLVHFDAHLDYIDEVCGVRTANGSPLRRVAELPFVRQMVHIGIRDIRSREENYLDAVARGNLVFTRGDVRRLGPAGIVERIPPLERFYITIDIDGMDPSIAPGTGSPTVDGLLYHELREMLRGLVAKGRVVGFDLVEVNPLLDPTGRTALLATTAILEFLGFILGDGLRRSAAGLNRGSSRQGGT